MHDGSHSCTTQLLFRLRRWTLRLTVQWVVVTALAIVCSHARVRSMLYPGWWESILSLMVVSLNFSCRVHCPYLLLSLFHAGLGSLGCRCSCFVVWCTGTPAVLGHSCCWWWTISSSRSGSRFRRSYRSFGSRSGSRWRWCAAVDVSLHSCASHSCGLQIHKFIVGSISLDCC
jgi:hypothetical protein